MYQQFQTTCPDCGGQGEFVTKTCHVCHGDKLSDSIDELRVYVERGIPDGHQFNFEEAADEFLNVSSGTIQFQVTILKHDRFVRKGDDLTTHVEITLKEALVGFTKYVDHLDGRKVKL